MNQDKFFIGGDWVDPAGSDQLAVISPHTEEVIAKVPEATTADVDRAVAAAREAFDHGPWPQMSPAERADVIAAISAGIQARYEEMARTISEEMGSPITWATMGQVFAATMVLDYYADLAREYPFEERRPGILGPTLVRREPVGVVGAIVPWNVPLFVTSLKLGPALASGSTVVLKPAPETPLDAYLLAEIVQEAGLPAGVLNIVQADREVERVPRAPSRHRQDLVHRFRRRRPQDRRHLRRAAQALHPRARRQVGGDHPRRRRPRVDRGRASCRTRS